MPRTPAIRPQKADRHPPVSRGGIPVRVLVCWRCRSIEPRGVLVMAYARVVGWRACRGLTLWAAGLALVLFFSVVAPSHAMQVTLACPVGESSPLTTAAALLDLGCPTSVPFTTAASEQRFEHGSMMWLQEWGIISVLREDGGYGGYDDLYGPDKPESAGLTPPRDDLQEPVQGFGEIWRKLGGPDAGIGWASASETS